MTASVSITSHFKSSARINDQHFDPDIFLENFICHGTVQQTLSSLCAEVSGSAQRAFTLTGPYGSGKSTLALFLDCLLSPNRRVRRRALKKFSGADAEKRLNGALPYKKGWNVIKHLCDLGSPAHNLRNYSCVTFRRVLLVRGGNRRRMSSGDQEALSNPGKQCDGVVVIIDELGKALDYQAASGGDLHFFQSLADAVQSNSNVVVIGLLHQSFAAYARKRDSSTQNEWGKVQGGKDFRFNLALMSRFI